jgi:hypothetical protein
LDGGTGTFVLGKGCMWLVLIMKLPLKGITAIDFPNGQSILLVICPMTKQEGEMKTQRRGFLLEN